MAAPYEAFVSRDSVSLEKNGQRTGQRLFYTDYRDPVAAVADATYSVIPSLSPPATFPGDTALKLDRKTAQKREDGTYSVVCDYSTNNKFTDNTVIKTPGAFYSWQGSMQTVEATIYIAAQRNINLPVAPGTTPAPVKVWQGIPYKIREKRQIITLTIRKTGVTTAQPFNDIANQYQTLHTLAGQDWLFAQGDATQSNQNEWEFTYQWIFDGGTKKPTLGDTSLFVPTPDGLAAYTNFARPPYTELAYVDQDDPESGPGDTYTVALYPKNANGWRSLPGISGVPGL